MIMTGRRSEKKISCLIATFVRPYPNWLFGWNSKQISATNKNRKHFFKKWRGIIEKVSFLAKSCKILHV